MTKEAYIGSDLEPILAELVDFHLECLEHCLTLENEANEAFTDYVIVNAVECLWKLKNELKKMQSALMSM